MKKLTITPLLLNSANPWCTTLDQLRALYASPHTGAVTTRTSLLIPFPHDPTVHQFTFFDPTTLTTTPPNTDHANTGDVPPESGSLNTLGYSPLPLSTYLDFIKDISDALPMHPTPPSVHFKPFIISITGSPSDVVQCYRLITSHQRTVRMALSMEVNLSCPNIPGKPPPAYDAAALLTYLVALKEEIVSQLGDGDELEASHPHEGHVHVPIGIKTPPYTYQGQFQALIDALLGSALAEPKHLPCPVSFITATNTLGTSLLLKPFLQNASRPPHQAFHHTLDSAGGTGLGGLAGAPLHPLALGNVYTIKGLLFQHEELEQIQIIGVGGVEDVDGFNRMRAVGAAAVGVGTALGRKGLKVFEEIGQALQKSSL